MWEVIVEKYNPFNHTIDHFKYTDFSTKQEVIEYVNDLMADDHECGIWINDLIDDDGEYFDGPKCLQNLACKTYKGK